MPDHRRTTDPYRDGNRGSSGGHTNETPINPTGSNYSWDMLLNASETNPNIENFISMLFGQENEWNALQRKDWNKEVMSAALQQLIQNNINKYNEGLRDDARNYDLPINQLSRLMSAGIGRDAALELLSGGAGAGSGGSGAPYQSAPGLSSIGTPSESTLNGVSTAGNIVGSAIGLVNCGMSANVAFHQAQLLKNQNVLTKNQLDASVLFGEAYQLLSNEVKTGIISDDDGHLYDSVTSICDGLEALAKAGNLTAQDWHGTGKINQLRALAPYAAPVLADFYKQSRSGMDYDISFSKELLKKDMSLLLDSISYDSIAQGISQSTAEIGKIWADTDFIRENITLLKEQAKLIKSQVKNYDADTRYKKLMSRAQDLENQLNSSFVEGTISFGNNPDGQRFTGAQLFGLDKLTQLKTAAKTHLELARNGFWHKQVEMDMSDADQLIATNTLRHMILKGSIDQFNQYSPEQKSLFFLANCYQQSGTNDYLQNLINANTSTNKIGPVSVTEVSPVARKSVNELHVLRPIK